MIYHFRGINGQQCNFSTLYLPRTLLVVLLSISIVTQVVATCILIFDHYEARRNKFAVCRRWKVFHFENFTLKDYKVQWKYQLLYVWLFNSSNSCNVLTLIDYKFWVILTQCCNSLIVVVTISNVWCDFVNSKNEDLYLAVSQLLIRSTMKTNSSTFEGILV